MDSENFSQERLAPTTELHAKSSQELAKWYVMRDLSRPNAKVTMYQTLSELGFQVFTPEHWVIKKTDGKTKRVKEIIFKSLLFVHSTMNELTPILLKYSNLQYRYQYGRSIKDPMTVPEAEMNRFIQAIQFSLSTPLYLSSDELTPDKCGREIEIIGGPLNGLKGTLLKMRGTKVKRILVMIPGLLGVAAEVEPEYIRLC